MAVSNGQLADQTTFNTAFMSRTIDTSTVGRVDLNNAVAASGASISNIQRLLNGFASVIGVASSIVYNFTITWASDIVGAANDTIKARVEALVARFLLASGHNHDGTEGNGALISISKLSGAVIYEQAIVQGSSQVVIVFPGGIDLGVTDYKVFWGIRNTVDGQSIALTGRRTATAGTGFTFELDAAVDSANYVFEYAAFKKTG